MKTQIAVTFTYNTIKLSNDDRYNDHLDDQINEFLENNPDYILEHITMMDGTRSQGIVLVIFRISNNDKL